MLLMDEATTKIACPSGAWDDQEAVDTMTRTDTPSRPEHELTQTEPHPRGPVHGVAGIPVSDDGPGIPPDQRHTMQKRLTAAHAPSPQAPGSASLSWSNRPCACRGLRPRRSRGMFVCVEDAERGVGVSVCRGGPSAPGQRAGQAAAGADGRWRPRNRICGQRSEWEQFVKGTGSEPGNRKRAVMKTALHLRRSIRSNCRDDRI